LEHAYVLRVLVGDYHLARARELAALPALDPDFGGLHERRGSTRRRDRAGARAALERARLAYLRAAPRGRRQDACFDCGLRAGQIAARLETVTRSLPG
jgi:hypothetical protein